MANHEYDRRLLNAFESIAKSADEIKKNLSLLNKKVDKIIEKERMKTSANVIDILNEKENKEEVE